MTSVAVLCAQAWGGGGVLLSNEIVLRMTPTLSTCHCCLCCSFASESLVLATQHQHQATTASALGSAAAEAEQPERFAAGTRQHQGMSLPVRPMTASSPGSNQVGSCSHRDAPVVTASAQRPCSRPGSSWKLEAWQRDSAGCRRQTDETSDEVSEDQSWLSYASVANSF